MRNNFLEEFYHGNIAPQSQSFSKDNDFKTAWDKLSKNEEILSKILTGEEHRVLSFLQAEQKEKNCAILCYNEEIPLLDPKNLLPVGDRSTLEAQAKRLFHALRDADGTDATVIYAHLPPMEGLGLALYNRMIRAAAHTIQKII